MSTVDLIGGILFALNIIVPVVGYTILIQRSKSAND
jgi:hypothetical protein